MRLLRKYVALDRESRRIAAQALVMVGLVRLALAVLPYRTVQAWLARSSQRPEAEGPPTTAQLRYGRRVVSAVEAVAKNVLADKPCLTQALVAQWFLARAGLETTLRIGVARGERRELKAHAWLERDGRVILGGSASPYEYTPLAPARPATP